MFVIFFPNIIHISFFHFDLNVLNKTRIKIFNFERLYQLVAKNYRGLPDKDRLENMRLLN